MAVKFLTDEWAQAMAEAVNSDDNFKSVAGGISLCVQQDITGAPAGDTSYHMGIKDGEAFCAIGAAESPDLTVKQSYDVAVQIAKGELNLQNAFMQGQVQVQGNLAIAMQYQPQLQSLEGAISGVEVEYD
ncbi:MAG: hypothetical protein DYH08_13835 [Actinobacteria bacterium ATB1]|nr:hypothetical protein [Actinobacteria bacterium ATB1]